MYVSNIDVRHIMKTIMGRLIKHTPDNDKKIKIIEITATIEHNMCLGNKEMLYLQQFFVELMKIFI